MPARVQPATPPAVAGCRIGPPRSTTPSAPSSSASTRAAGAPRTLVAGTGQTATGLRFSADGARMLVEHAATTATITRDHPTTRDGAPAPL